MLARLRAATRRRLARRLRLPEIPVALAGLKARGFAPQSIFDVGAYQGEFALECLKIWAGARVACFEPLPQAAQHLDVLAAKIGTIDVHRALLGADEAEAVALHSAETASSVLDEHHTNHPTLLSRQTTIDAVVADRYQARAPDLLKIDVQGYELEVLKGASRSLPGIGAILVELNLLDLHRNVPLIAEIIGWLDARRFVAYDICGLHWRPLDGALWQTDMIFVPVDSPLRADKRWA